MDVSFPQANTQADLYSAQEYTVPQAAYAAYNMQQDKSAAPTAAEQASRQVYGSNSFGAPTAFGSAFSSVGFGVQDNSQVRANGAHSNATCGL